jgi:MFS transporter, DHA1 family, multidrug resistance protein
VAALAMAGLFAYIAGASFVLQDRYGINQQDFALLFGAGAVALIASTQANPVLLTWFSPMRIVLTALSVAGVASAVFLALALTHTGGVWGFLVPVWTILAAMGLVMPNAPALALSRHPESAGTAAALMGAAQFGLGALVAPLVGVLGNDAVAMAAVMAVSVVIALVALLSVRQGATDSASARAELAAEAA